MSWITSLSRSGISAIKTRQGSMYGYIQLRRKLRIRFCGLILVLIALLLLLWFCLMPTRKQWLPHVTGATGLKKDNFALTFPSTRSNLNRTLTILLWTPWFKNPDWSQKDFSKTFSSCPTSNCVLTKDKFDIVKADALLFHAPDLWNGVNGYRMPEYRRSDQVWIWQNAESPPHNPTSPEIYNHIFNWTVSYRRNSDIHTPYFKTKKLDIPRPSAENIAATKSAGIAWVASNCQDDARRQILVREINKYIPVDTYGKCGEKELSKNDMDIVLKKYKFYLAFENSYCRDYITEKFSKALQRHNLPIVVGGEGYRDLAPPRSFIDITLFSSIRVLADYLKFLDRNETAYNTYFDWTRDHSVTTHPNHWCALCEALHDETRPPQVYTDLVGYIDDDICSKHTTVLNARGRWKGRSETVFIHHINIVLLKKEENKKTLDPPAKIASALRNTWDGEILGHIEGQQREDRNLKSIDEAVTKRLETLTDGGELYHEVFERFWISCNEDYLEFADFVVVKKTQGVATFDFNTKISNDFENTNPVTLKSCFEKHNYQKHMPVQMNFITLHCRQ